MGSNENHQHVELGGIDLHRQKITIRVITLILTLVVFFANTVLVFAGGSPDKLGEEELKRAESLYKYMIANEYSAEAACGVLGNADQESGFDASIGDGSYSSGHYGYFQMSSSQWSEFKSWCTSEKLEYTDITVQFKYSESQLESDFNTYCIGLTYADWKKCNDIVTGFEGYMIAYERCVGDTATYTPTKVKYNYNFVAKYQDGETRKQYAEEFLTKFAGIKPAASDKSGNTDKTSDGDTTADKQTQGTMGTQALSNTFYTEEELSAYRKLGELNIAQEYLVNADLDNLGTDDLEAVENWKASRENMQEDNNITHVMRVIIQALGIFLTVYMILLYLAYWFDRLNNFFDIDLLAILTLGKFRISDTEDKCTYKATDLGDKKTKTVNHRAILTVTVIGLAFATLIMTGALFRAIQFIIFKIIHLFK